MITYLPLPPGFVPQLNAVHSALLDVSGQSDEPAAVDGSLCHQLVPPTRVTRT